jgi:chromosome segregation ATPase
MTNEYETRIDLLHKEYCQEKITLENNRQTIINEKNDEINHLHQQLVCQRSQVESHQDTIEHLRQDIHQYQQDMSNNVIRIDQLSDEQKRVSQSMIRLKTILNVDVFDPDELIEQLAHKLEQTQTIRNECERLTVDLSKEKLEKTHLNRDLQHIEQQYDEMKERYTNMQDEFVDNKSKYESECQQLNQTLEQLREEKDRYNVQYNQLQRQYVEQTEHYDALQRQYNVLSTDKDEQIVRYQCELNEHLTTIDKYRRESNDAHDELKSKQNQIDSLQNAFDKVQEQVQLKMFDIDKINEQIRVYEQERQQYEQRLVDERTRSHEDYVLLETKYHDVRTDKAELEHRLDTIRLEMQSNIDNERQEFHVQLECAHAQVKQLQVRSTMKTTRERERERDTCLVCSMNTMLLEHVVSYDLDRTSVDSRR